MSLESTIAHRQPILAEGSVYELLRRSPAVAFDPQLAHAALVFDPSTLDVLESTHRAYCATAAEHHLPIMTFTDTWRANRERIAGSAFAGEKVNLANAQFLCELRDSYGPDRPDTFVAGLTGCRGNAYQPQEALTTEAARTFHDAQISELSETPIDLLFAATLPALSEAQGIAMLMAQTDLPYVLSFVICRDGTLLDGTPIDQALDTIDSAVSRLPLGYYVNCVHPEVVMQASRISTASSLTNRFIGFQANTSALSAAELDEIGELQSAPPRPFAELVMQVGQQCGMTILGGCCGTDTTHISCLAQLMAER